VDIKVKKKQNNSRMCFVCGLSNKFGLKASFYEMENNELVALFTPGDEHQSYPGRLHGGIATTILDETIGRAILNACDEETWGVTIDLNTKFRKPVPLNQELKVVARITSDKGRFFLGTGEIRLPNGDIAVTAEGRYLKLPISKIADFDHNGEDWFLTENEDEPKALKL